MLNTIKKWLNKEKKISLYQDIFDSIILIDIKKFNRIHIPSLSNEIIITLFNNLDDYNEHLILYLDYFKINKHIPKILINKESNAKYIQSLFLNKNNEFINEEQSLNTLLQLIKDFLTLYEEISNKSNQTSLEQYNLMLTKNVISDIRNLVNSLTIVSNKL